MLAMELKPPFQISARLMPAIRIGSMWVSLQFCGCTPTSRLQYQYCLDDAESDIEYEASNLYRGRGIGVDIQAAMADLLRFLTYYADSDDVDDLSFPPAVLDWAGAHATEIDDMADLLEAGAEFIKYSC